MASARVIPTTPNFDAQYAVASGRARRPSVDATVTILPRLSLSAGSAARMTAAVPNRLTATTRSHSAAGTSPSAPQRSVPAAVTTASTPPARSISARMASSAAAVSARSVTACERGPRGRVVRDGDAVDEQRAATGGGHRGGDGPAEAGRGAGDEHGADAAGRARPAGAGSTGLMPSGSVMSEAAVSGRVWVTGFLPSG